MTRLETLQKHGIRRLRTSGRGFRYAASNDAKAGREDRARIRTLRIPPAWTDVVINRSPGGLLQAVGMDAAGRWQYLFNYRGRNLHQAERALLRLLKRKNNGNSRAGLS